MVVAAGHSGSDAARLDAVFKALASDQRREILRFLGEYTSSPGRSCCAQADVCACDLTERLGLAASTISHHMAILKDAGLVTSRKKGLWVHYGLQREALTGAAEELRRY